MKTQEQSNNGSANNVATPTIQSEDGLGLHQAVNGLYLAIEKNDLETAFKYTDWIKDVARDYANPDSEANGSAEKSATPKEELNDSYGIVDLAFNVVRAGNKQDEHGVQEAVKELNTATMDYFEDIANQ
ncbi:hypothetical protein WKK_05375 [Weissella koreensis KACC 15510]|uniref:hypothetical protein n=1 Tax=Weissella koreensis TaxID=165096 RepID=UPI0002175053|nr:hypothetical protein [Weissella koreensis]AEJ23946.1 hypothetical protein WKK_05375 [Weissella koreensis KACC 15510]